MKGSVVFCFEWISISLKVKSEETANPLAEGNVEIKTQFEPHKNKKYVDEDEIEGPRLPWVEHSFIGPHHETRTIAILIPCSREDYHGVLRVQL